MYLRGIFFVLFCFIFLNSFSFQIICAFRFRFLPANFSLRFLSDLAFLILDLIIPLSFFRFSSNCSVVKLSVVLIKANASVIKDKLLEILYHHPFISLTYLSNVCHQLLQRNLVSTHQFWNTFHFYWWFLSFSFSLPSWHLQHRRQCLRNHI